MAATHPPCGGSRRRDSGPGGRAFGPGDWDKEINYSNTNPCSDPNVPNTIATGRYIARQPRSLFPSLQGSALVEELLDSASNLVMRVRFSRVKGRSHAKTPPLDAPALLPRSPPPSDAPRPH